MTIKQAIQKRNKLWAESDKLYAEGRKLRAEGNLLVINAVIKEHGPDAQITFDGNKVKVKTEIEKVY